MMEPRKDKVALADKYDFNFEFNDDEESVTIVLIDTERNTSQVKCITMDRLVRSVFDFEIATGRVKTKKTYKLAPTLVKKHFTEDGETSICNMTNDNADNMLTNDKHKVDCIRCLQHLGYVDGLPPSLRALRKTHYNGVNCRYSRDHTVFKTDITKEVTCELCLNMMDEQGIRRE